MTLKGSIKVFPGSAVPLTAASKQERKSRQSSLTVNQLSIVNIITPLSKLESFIHSLTHLDVYFGDRHLGGRLPLKFIVKLLVSSFYKDHKFTIWDRVYLYQDVSIAHISHEAVSNVLRARYSYQADFFDTQ